MRAKEYKLLNKSVKEEKSLWVFLDWVILVPTMLILFVTSLLLIFSLRFLMLLAIMGLGAALIYGALIYGGNKSSVERKPLQINNELQEEYKNSLYGVLNQFSNFRNTNDNSAILKDFYKISDIILDTEKGLEGKFSKENMIFFDEQAYHELLALKEILKALRKNIPITDETIQKSLQQVTKGLQKHYDLYYQQNLESVEEELLILTKLEK